MLAKRGKDLLAHVRMIARHLVGQPDRSFSAAVNAALDSYSFSSSQSAS
jgi:hypothetical protein